MPENFRFEIKGSEHLKMVLQELPKSARNKALRRAITAGTTPILRQARANAPVGETGLLKKALKRKIKTYKSGTVVGIVGADRSVSGTNKLGKKHVPANILHLVESGHGGPAPAPAHPFLRPAYDSTQHQAGTIAVERLKVEVESEAARLAAQGDK